MNDDLKQYILKLAKKRGLVKGASYDFYTSKTNEYAGKRHITEKPYFSDSFHLVHNGYIIWQPEKGWSNIENIRSPESEKKIKEQAKEMGLVNGAKYDHFNHYGEFLSRNTIQGNLEYKYNNALDFHYLTNGRNILWKEEGGWLVDNIQQPEDQLEELVRPLADYLQKHYDPMVQINVGMYDYEVLRSEERGKITEELPF